MDTVVNANLQQQVFKFSLFFHNTHDSADCVTIFMGKIFESKWLHQLACASCQTSLLRRKTYFIFYWQLSRSFPGSSVVKSLPAEQELQKDTGSIPGLGRSLAGRHGNPLHYSCLENPMDRGAWQATVHRVAKSWIQLKWLTMHIRTQECLRVQGLSALRWSTFPLGLQSHHGDDCLDKEWGSPLPQLPGFHTPCNNVLKP